MAPSQIVERAGNRATDVVHDAKLIELIDEGVSASKTSRQTESPTQHKRLSMHSRHSKHLTGQSVYHTIVIVTPNTALKNPNGLEDAVAPS